MFMQLIWYFFPVSSLSIAISTALGVSCPGFSYSIATAEGYEF